MSLADDMAADLAQSPAGQPAASAPRVSLADEMAAHMKAARPAPPMPAMDPSAGSNSLTVGIPGTRFQVDIPASETVNRAFVGAGKSVADMGRGIGQLTRAGLESVGQKATADKLGLTTRADVDEANRLDAPLMDTTAGKVGYVAGSLATSMLPTGIAARAGVPLAATVLNPRTYTAAAGVGALTGAMQPVGTGDNRGLNTLIGAGTGMLGNAAVNTVGRIAQPVQAAIDPLRQRAVQVLQRYGVPLDAAQTSGGNFVNRLRSSFSDNPFTAGAQADLIGHQRAAYNNAVLGTIGETGHAVTPEVMDRADRRIGGVFQDILNRNNVQVTDPLLTRVAAVQQAANDEERPAVSNIANRFMAAVDGTGAVPGQAAYNIKKDLDRLASSSDSTLAYHARQLRSTIMDGINESLAPEDRAAFTQARQQFRNMKTIEPAIDKEGSGNISPSILANTMGQKANRQASLYGRGNQDLAELAKAGKMLLGDKTPNSGTTARAAMQLLAPLGATVAGGAYDAYGGDYTGALTKGLGAGAAMIAAPRAAQFFINNPATARYLSQGMQTMPLRNMLLAPQTNAAVGGTLRRLPFAYDGAPQGPAQ